MSTNANSALNRHMTSAAIIARLVGRKVFTALSHTGEDIKSILYFRGTPGQVILDVLDEEADGVLTYSHPCELGGYKIHETTFRLANRRLARKAHVSRKTLWFIRTEVALQLNLRIVNIKWGRHSHSRELTNAY